MKKYQIALLVVAVLAIVGVAMFAIPISHHVTYEYIGYSGGWYRYNTYTDGVFTSIFPTNTYHDPASMAVYYHDHTVAWSYPYSPDFDFSWLPFVN